MADPVADAAYDPTHWCPRCERGIPASKCRPVELGELSGAHMLVCSTCGSVTRPVDVVESVELAPLYRAAIRYPVDDGHALGLVALAAGAWFFSHVPLAGGAFALAIVITYLLSVIPHTARGRDTLPEPSDFVHFTDYLWPALRATAACVPGVAPFVLVGIYGDGLPSALRTLLLAVTGALAMAWLPGAAAWAAMTNTLGSALDPRPVLAVVTRVPREYAFTVAVVWGLCLVGVMLTSVVEQLTGSFRFLPIVPAVIRYTAAIYAPMVMARVVGLLLRARRDEIGVDL